MRKALLELLVCPISRGPLVHDRKRRELRSPQAGVAYPIRNGIPILLADEARPLSPDRAQVSTEVDEKT